MRGLHAHQVCVHGIERWAGKGDRLQGKTQKLADGLHQLWPPRRSDEKWSWFDPALRSAPLVYQN